MVQNVIYRGYYYRNPLFGEKTGQSITDFSREDGFLINRVDKIYNLFNVETVLITGNDILLADINGVTSEGKWVQIGDFDKERSDNFTLIKKSQNWEENFIRNYLYDDGIKSITASSYLVEKGRNFQPTALENKLIIWGPGELYFQYRHNIGSWVEGVSGDGLGEYLVVNFDNLTDGLIILNGYVDLSNRSLYMDNNRVKTIRITSENPGFSFDFELKDEVSFQEINFPMKSQSVKLEIKDIYSGRLYSDTSISALFSKPLFSRTREIRKNEMLNLLNTINE